jgi:hypothetical protein
MNQSIQKSNMNLMMVCVIAGFMCGVLATPAFATFVDGFEGAELDHFWTTSISSGSITFPSPTMVHSGAHSVQLNSAQGGEQTNVQFSHYFDTPVYGTFSIWIYDTGAGASSRNYGAFFAGPEVENGWGSFHPNLQQSVAEKWSE